MYTVFLVLQIIVTLALVGLILVQRNDSDGLGSMGGGGGGNAFMTGRGHANLLTRSTAILATIFMINSLWLAIMASSGNDSSSLVDELAEDDAATVSVPLADEDEPAEAPMDADTLLAPEMPVTSTPEAQEEAPAAPEADAPAAAPQDSPSDATGDTPVIPIP